jgi:hypothetical protein
MDIAPLALESFSDKVEKIEKALEEGESAHFLNSNGSKTKLKGILTRISSVPCCEICDNSLKRLKLFAKVSIFYIGIAASVFLFSKLSPFFSTIYELFSGIYDFLAGAFEWVGDFLRTAYNWILGSFESISEYFVQVLEFFEDFPEVIEGFFPLFLLI